MIYFMENPMIMDDLWAPWILNLCMGIGPNTSQNEFQQASEIKYNQSRMLNVWYYLLPTFG